MQGQEIRTFRTFRTITKVLFFFEYRNTTCRYKYRKLVTRGLHLSEKLWWTDSGLVTHELQMRYARTPPPIPFHTIVFLSTVYPLKLCYSLPFKGAPTAVPKLHLVHDQIVQSSWLCTHRTTRVHLYLGASLCMYLGTGTSRSRGTWVLTSKFIDSTIAPGAVV